MAVVLQTDFAWPDTDIERSIIEGAGHQYVVGQAEALPASEIEALVARHDPQAIMTCWAQVSAVAIGASSHLQIVQRIGVGLDNIAVESATARGAWVANVPDYCMSEVSDHAIALMLAWARGAVAFDKSVKAGHWNPAAASLRRVSDLTVGMLGYGRIARETARKLHGFGCNILVHRASDAPVEFGAVCDFEMLLASSDVLILHAPLTSETHHLLNAATIARMKRGAFLINVSRGPLIDNAALADALASGHLAGAGLDVVEGEPSPPESLVSREDVIVTPHIAFSSDASLAELRRKSAEEVVRVLEGHDPLNPCNNPEPRS